MFIPILPNVDGSVTSVKDLQLKNKLFSSLVTHSGIVILFKLVHSLNAESPRV